MFYGFGIENILILYSYRSKKTLLFTNNLRVYINAGYYNNAPHVRLIDSSS